MGLANALDDTLTEDESNETPVERPEEYAPGLDPELLALVQATAELELTDAADPMASAGAKKK